MYAICRSCRGLLQFGESRMSLELHIFRQATSYNASAPCEDARSRSTQTLYLYIAPAIGYKLAVTKIVEDCFPHIDFTNRSSGFGTLDLSHDCGAVEVPSHGVKVTDENNDNRQ